MCKLMAIRYVLGVFLVSVTITSTSSADGPSVDLLLEPELQAVRVGHEVLLDLIAHSSDGSTQEILGIDAILTWDPADLELRGVERAGEGYAWERSGFLPSPGSGGTIPCEDLDPECADNDDVNCPVTADPPGGVPYNDGVAMYTAIAQDPPDELATVGPAALHVTTIRFLALTKMPPGGTTVSFMDSCGDYSETRVLGRGLNNNITGDTIGAIVSIPIPAVSAWGLLIMALLGLTAGTIMYRRERVAAPI